MYYGSDDELANANNDDTESSDSDADDDSDESDNDDEDDASTVFESSIAMVIGPTPPGTGVTMEAT